MLLFFIASNKALQKDILFQFLCPSLMQMGGSMVPFSMGAIEIW